MRFWFSPFPLEAKLQKQLSSQGVHHAEHARCRPAELLVLYDAPHALALSAASGLTVDALTEGYRRLLALVRDGATAVAISRLQAFTPHALRNWLKGEAPPPEIQATEEPSAMAALLAINLLELRPALLEAYLDLELHADLLGGNIDGQYLSRLRRIIASVEPDHLLREWHAPVLASSQTAERMSLLEGQLAERDRRIQELEKDCSTANLSLKEHREKQGRTLTLLDQCQAENTNQRKQLAALQTELDTLRSTLEEKARQAVTLKDESQTLASQIREAHVELERTFLSRQRSVDLGRQCQVELRRAEALLRRLP